MEPPRREARRSSRPIRRRSAADIRRSGMAPMDDGPMDGEPTGPVAIGIGGFAGATVVALWLTGPPTAGVPPIVGEALDIPVEERAAAALVAGSLRPVPQAASARAAAIAVPKSLRTIVVPPWCSMGGGRIAPGSCR
jgi:hypothetical protein